MMINRFAYHTVEKMLQRYPAVGLLGPRQVGKTTLALKIGEQHKSVYLDLELPSDLIKLQEPESYFRAHEDKLIILDEIQRAPEIFQILRSLIDIGRRQGHKSGRFLILGSANLDLLKQSSESLAGRIAYQEMYPLLINEIDKPFENINNLWVRGGFPESYLAYNEEESFDWRASFIKTYLERDIPQFGPRIPAETLRRLWTMLAHNQSEMLNAAKLAGALAISGVTIARYIDLLVDLLLVRRLHPWISNASKRLVRSPKVYIRDSGLTHALLGIRNYDDLVSHPVVGQSWEAFVIETLIACAPNGCDFNFYRTAAGAEIDLVITLPHNKLMAIEIKRSLNPVPQKGFYFACEDIKPTYKYVVYAGKETFFIDKDIVAISLRELINLLQAS